MQFLLQSAKLDRTDLRMCKVKSAYVQSRTVQIYRCAKSDLPDLYLACANARHLTDELIWLKVAVVAWRHLLRLKCPQFSSFPIANISCEK